MNRRFRDKMAAKMVRKYETWTLLEPPTVSAVTLPPFAEVVSYRLPRIGGQKEGYVYASMDTHGGNCNDRRIQCLGT